MNSWLVWDFIPTKIFVVGFMLDFFIRIFINPKFSPTLILAKFIVSNQKIDYVWAPQKRFAWSIGFILAITMFYLVVLNNIVGPINLFVCVSCLILLGFEAFFCICIWCKVYNLFNKEKSKFCPGWICEKTKKENIQKVWFLQLFIFIIFIVFIFFISKSSLIESKTENVVENFSIEENNQKKDKCEVPSWAIKMWHSDKWKLHHNCN
jgi:ABC-type Fe3+-siderophore transport system permease subunit